MGRSTVRALLSDRAFGSWSPVHVPAPLVCLDWPKSPPPLAAQRHAAKVGRRVLGELKRLERQLEDAGLMPDD